MKLTKEQLREVLINSDFFTEGDSGGLYFSYLEYVNVDNHLDDLLNELNKVLDSN